MGKKEQLGVGLVTKVFGDAASDKRGYTRALNDVLRLIERDCETYCDGFGCGDMLLATVREMREGK